MKKREYCLKKIKIKTTINVSNLKEVKRMEEMNNNNLTLTLIVFLFVLLFLQSLFIFLH